MFKPTDEQTHFFMVAGQLLVHDVFPDNLVEQLTAEFEELEARPEEKGGIWQYFETTTTGEEVTSRLENFIYHMPEDSATRKLVLEDIPKIVESLIGEEVVLFKEKINFKKPGSAGFEPHQDAQAGWLSYGLTNFVNVAIGIDEMTVENGCLQTTAQGWNDTRLIAPEFKPFDPKDIAALPWKHMPATSNDMLIFSAFAPHRSDPNKTLKQRRVLLATYNLKREGDAREQYLADKMANHPPRVEKDPTKQYRGYVI
jgi:ectoine hydroxylase-related dioxygenase (phytanoyl-CoA dioxygenase family)